jgi:small subunit ribosomal protein S8
MVMTDPISDMLTRIRNACQAKHRKVDIPASKLKLEIAKLMTREKYIDSYKHIKAGDYWTIRVYLKYTPEEDSVITGLKRVSRPGCRRFAKKDGIPYVLGGLGCALLTTSHGILTDRECRQKGIGGEILCYIW